MQLEDTRVFWPAARCDPQGFAFLTAEGVVLQRLARYLHLKSSLTLLPEEADILIY